jgi:flagellar hook assembly protein FlgD
MTTQWGYEYAPPDWYPLADGVYTLTLSITDVLGNNPSSRSITVSIDTKKPTASASVYPTSFNPTLGQTTRLGYTLSENCYVTIRVYNGAGSLARTLVNNALVSSGAHSVTWNGKTSSGTKLPLGTYTFRLYVTDRAGNKATTYPITRTAIIK